jgi:hypothetical protein
MEPISTTVICNILTYFIGYYIGADFYNYYKSQQNFREIKDDLFDIKEDLLDIKSSLNYIKNKVP